MKPDRIGVGPCDGARGFTLVELTAVIAILGILAAAALPRIAALAGEARYAALDSARGALVGVAAMAHAGFVIDGRTSHTFEDSKVTLVNGYPAATQATVDAAGLAASYVAYTQPAAATATTPPVAAGSMSLVPRDIAGTTKAPLCFLVYEQASGAGSVPKAVLGGTTNAQGCN